MGSELIAHPAQIGEHIGGGGVALVGVFRQELVDELVDVRETVEREADGAIPGSFHVPRGMLEFKADPDSPLYEDELNPDDRLILFCGTGGRSALAAKTLFDMGYRDVSSLVGGYAAWCAAQNGPSFLEF